MNEESQQLDPELIDGADSLCSEEEFAEILSEQSHLLLHIEELAQRNPQARFSRRIHATIMEESVDIEDLLDDYDARYNKSYASLLELVASLRGFSAVGYCLKNVQMRTRPGGFLEDPQQDEDFRNETEATQRFADQSVRILLRQIRDEIQTVCGLEDVGEPPSRMISQDGAVQKKLPHTLGANDNGDVRTLVATEASLFLAAHKVMLHRSACRKFDDIDEMRRFVLDICDEEQSRFLEAKLENIQSRYDTFVRNSVTEREDVELRNFRYMLEISLQLTRVLRNLVHFYERHEDDLRTEEAKVTVPLLIDKATVLDRILNFGLYYVYQFMGRGVPIAEALLSTYTTKEVVTLTIPDGCMLHARPSSLISKVVVHHGTPIEMTMGKESCYAGSVMQVILLAGNNLEEREVTFSGDRGPIQDIVTLFECGLGEVGMDVFPDRLAYLLR